MKAIGFAALAVALTVQLTACGDDDGGPPPPVDGGGGGDDGGGGTDAPGMFDTFTFSLRFLDSDDAPLEGVHVAVDTDRGRFEGMSDASGELDLTVEYGDDRFQSIAALERYTIGAVNGTITQSRMNQEEAGGRIDAVLGLVGAATMGPQVDVDIAATGVPAGGRWCAGVGSWFTVCQAEGEAYSIRPYLAQLDGLVQDDITAYAYDDSGVLVDFTEATWTVETDGSRSAMVTFDGTFDVTPVTRSITLTLPTDAESPFRTETLDPEWSGWFNAVAPGTYLSRAALTDVMITDDQVTATINTFPSTDGDLVWAMAAYADFDDPARTFRWFSAEPTADTFEVLDLPRVTSATSWNERVDWTAPAADIDFYNVGFYVAGSSLVINLRTSQPQGTVPELPSTYDADVSFPFPGAMGEVAVTALRGDFPDDIEAAGFLFDAEAALGPRTPISF